METLLSANLEEVDLWISCKKLFKVYCLSQVNVHKKLTRLFAGLLFSLQSPSSTRYKKQN